MKCASASSEASHTHAIGILTAQADQARADQYLSTRAVQEAHSHDAEAAQLGALWDQQNDASEERCKARADQLSSPVAIEALRVKFTLEDEANKPVQTGPFD